MLNFECNFYAVIVNTNRLHSQGKLAANCVPNVDRSRWHCNRKVKMRSFFLES